MIGFASIGELAIGQYAPVVSTPTNYTLTASQMFITMSLTSATFVLAFKASRFSIVVTFDPATIHEKWIPRPFDTDAWQIVAIQNDLWATESADATTWTVTTQQVETWVPKTAPGGTWTPPGG